MTTPAVTFDPAAWKAAFPEFTNISDAAATGYFNRACGVFANDVCNPAFPSGQMTNLFNLLTSHVAFMSAPRDAMGNPFTPDVGVVSTPASPLVGRISSASEGSVNVSAEYSSSGSPSEAWFLQTKYGAEFWQGTQQFRAAVYFANPTTVWGGVFPAVFAGGFRRRAW